MYRPEREQAFAKTALTVMSDCNVMPTPENFELFYAFAAGENPAVAQVISQMIAAHTPFTAEVLLDLRQRCLSSVRAARAMDRLDVGMGEVINSVLGRLEAAGREAVDYSNTLSAATGALGTDRTQADLRQLVDGLMAATREMEGRTKSLETELQRSSEQVTELRGKLDNVRKESLTDPLTGIANRKAFDIAMDGAITKPPEEPVCLLICDIDHFKKFNDSWGHQTGDQVLRLVANCLSENVNGRDTAARYGGEEFAVILRNTNLAGAILVADQIRLAVQGPKLVKKSTGDVLGTITISIGVSLFDDKDTIETVIRRADACLYGAKQNGRNLVIDQGDPRMIGALETNAA